MTERRNFVKQKSYQERRNFRERPNNRQRELQEETEAGGNGAEARPEGGERKLGGSSLERSDLEKLLLTDLQEIAREMGISRITGVRKKELIDSILQKKAEEEGLSIRTGILDILPEGYGFLRTNGYLPSEGDIYVSLSQIRRFHLKRGDEITGQVRAPKESEKYHALLRIESINGSDPEACRGRRQFEQLTPLYPVERLRLETPQEETASRIIDLIAPIGKGQRGLIVSPPRAGKTTILKQFANSITVNNPEVYLIVLLVDERPEEVTDMERSVKGEVVSSTFDQPSENHIQVAELVLERAKRLVEHGRDVVILLDSITRLARAYNLTTPTSGRILSGGVDSTALFPPKRFFGAARNIEEGREHHHHRHRPGGHGIAHGRGHLRGVQGDRQHGAAPGPQAGGQAHLPGHRHREVGYAQRGAAHGTSGGPGGLEAAPGAPCPGPQRRHRAAHRQDPQHQEQPRVPGGDRQVAHQLMVGEVPCCDGCNGSVGRVLDFAAGGGIILWLREGSEV